MTKRLIAGAALAGLVVLAGSSAAFAAQTRTLPAGENLYAIDCETSIGQLGQVDVATAEVTLIGSGTNDSHIDCASDAAWDSNTGTAYYVPWNSSYSLFALDVTTGESTYVADLHDADSNGLSEIYGLMMGTDGVLYGIGQLAAQNDVVALFTVNPQTAEFTVVHNVTEGGSDWSNGTFWSTSYNPADGQYYFIVNLDLYSIDVTTGAATFIGTQADSHYLYGMTFDSNGVLWSTGNDPVCSVTVDGWTTAGAMECTDADTYINGDTNQTWYAESNFIAYAVSTPTPTPTPSAAALASTGANAAGLGAAVVALIAAGGVLIAARKRSAA